MTVQRSPTTPDRVLKDIFTINTAGHNLISFACPDEDALISWVAALRLAVWEKARLEEIYTGHMLRITFSNTLLVPLVTGPSTRAPDWPQIPVPNISGAGGGGRWKEPRSPLVKGRLEGWVKVRPAGHTEWRRVLAVITASASSVASNASEFGVGDNGRPVSPTHSTLVKRNRMSSIFGGGSRDPPRPSSPPPQTSLQSKAVISLYAGSKPKERKTPLMTMTDATQAFCVYPDRKELIPLSSLIKVEGKLGEQDWVGGEGPSGLGTMKGREGWMFFMPESEGSDGNAIGLAPPVEMLKWVVGTSYVSEFARSISETHLLLSS